MTRLEKSTLSFRHCQNWRGDLVAKIDFDTSLTSEKVAHIACRGEARGNLRNAQKKGCFFWEVFPYLYPFSYYVSDI